VFVEKKKKKEGESKMSELKKFAGLLVSIFSVGLIALIALGVFSIIPDKCTGDKIANVERFEIVYEEDVRTGITQELAKILYDNETNKYYLIYMYDMNVAMCPLIGDTLRNSTPKKPSMEINQ